MFVQPRETLKGRLNILCGDITDILGLEDTDEPPITVTVVHKEQAIALYYAGLTLYGGCEAVEGVDQIKVDRFIGNRKGRGTVVVFVHILNVAVFCIRVIL